MCTKFGTAVRVSDVITCDIFLMTSGGCRCCRGGGENCNFLLTKPVAVNTGLTLPGSPLWRLMSADVGRNVGRSCRPIPVRLYAAQILASVWQCVERACVAKQKTRTAIEAIIITAGTHALYGTN